MVDSDDIVFAGHLAGLAEALAAPLSQAQITAYFGALRKYELESVVRAINEALITLRWFPKPVELIDLIEGAPSEQSLQAWHLVTDAIQRGGYYSSLYTDNPLIAFAIRRTFTSWMEAANELPAASSPTYTSLSKRFMAAFDLAKKQPAPVDCYFLGFYEMQNRNNVAMWETRDETEGEPTYPQKVIVIMRGQCFEAKLLASRLTGQLTEGSRQQLLQGAVVPHVLKIAPLPPARMIEGEAQPAQVQKQIAAYSAGSNREKIK